MTTHTSGYRSPGDVSMAELFPNHDGERPLAVDELAGRRLELAVEEGTHAAFTFKENAVDIEVTEAKSFLFLSGTLPCEVISLRPTILAAVIADERTGSSFYIVFDFDLYRAFIVHSDILSGPAGTGERTRFYSAGINGVRAETLAPTSDLVGKRIFWRYSDTHQFEHIYLEPNRYCWHGIKGPEQGMGGVEPASAFQLAENLYLFSWSDTSVAFNGTIAIDLAGDVHCRGRLFGWERSEQRGWQLVVGGPGKLLNETAYPDRI